MNQENNLPLHARTPSDCDEHVFAELPIYGESSKLQLINPDMLEICDTVYNSLVPMPYLKKCHAVAHSSDYDNEDSIFPQGSPCDFPPGHPLFLDQPSFKVVGNAFPFDRLNKLDSVEKLEENTYYDQLIQEWRQEYLQSQVAELQEHQDMQSKFQSKEISETEFVSWQMNHTYKHFIWFVEAKLALGEITQEQYNYWKSTP